MGTHRVGTPNSAASAIISKDADFSKANFGVTASGFAKRRRRARRKRTSSPTAVWREAACAPRASRSERAYSAADDPLAMQRIEQALDGVVRMHGGDRCVRIDRELRIEIARRHAAEQIVSVEPGNAAGSVLLTASADRRVAGDRGRCECHVGR